MVFILFPCFNQEKHLPCFPKMEILWTPCPWGSGEAHVLCQVPCRHRLSYAGGLCNFLSQVPSEQSGTRESPRTVPVSPWGRCCVSWEVSVGAGGQSFPWPWRRVNGGSGLLVCCCLQKPGADHSEIESQVYWKHTWTSAALLFKAAAPGLQLYRALSSAGSRPVPTAHPALSSPLTVCVPHTHRLSPTGRPCSESTAVNPWLP